MLDKSLKYLLLSFLLVPLANAQDDNLIVNPSFQQETRGWQSLWCREDGKGTATLVTNPSYGSTHALKVEYQGDRDWSIGQERQIPVKPGDIYSFSAWIKTENFRGAGQGQISLVTRDAQGQVLDWMAGMRNTTSIHDWQELKGKYLVQEGVATIQFRITGEAPGVTYWDGVELKKVFGAASGLSSAPATLFSGGTTFVYSPTDNKLFVWNQEGKTYVFKGWGKSSVVTNCAKAAENRLDLILADADGTTLAASAVVDLDGSILFSLKGNGPLSSDFEFPGAILSDAKQNWVVPLNEGLYVPTDDPYFKTWDLVLYSGHGLCMPFIGLTNGQDGLLAIAQTQNDSKAHFNQPVEGKTSSWSFLWGPSRQAWSYERKLRVQLVPTDGYVGIAKTYRAYAKAQGLVVTLKEKAAKNPYVDKLVGAVDLWWWADGPSWLQESNPEEYAKQMKGLGIERILWAHEQSPDSIKVLNDLGCLSGRYDIYQDVWGPDNPSSWTNKEGWDDCKTLLPNGDWMKGWVDRANGKEYPGGVLCSSCILGMAKDHIPADLKTHPYHARFLDTTTASPLRECYDPRHPLTRAQDRENKMALFDYVAQDQRLVLGSETGMDLAVPHLDYFEGMMSLGPYRLPDSGYDLFSYKKPQENLLRFQVGPFYRIPLFELVYHDCVVNYWYWGDASNRLPECWDARDLFNALYGNPPLWSMDEALWMKYKDRFVQSYKTATQVARKTGYSEMLSHSFLTDDHTVQTTHFADGTRVWVNFGEKPYRFSNGTELKAMDFKASYPTEK